MRFLQQVSCAIMTSLCLIGALSACSSRTSRQTNLKREVSVLNLSKQENFALFRKRHTLSTVTVERVSLKEVTIKDAIAWLSKETSCSMSLILDQEFSIASDVDPFSEDKSPQLHTFSVELKNVNLLEILDVICEKSNYYWRLSNSVILVAPKQHFVEK